MTFPRLLALLIWAWPCLATAQLHSPQKFLGYPLGDAFTPHHRVVDYFEHAAEASAQIALVRYGATYEGRPLLYVIVSSPANMSRLEEIRTGNLQRAGLLEGEPEGDVPAIVWLSYNVHGNESVSTEAAIKTIYTLADTTRAEVQAWLEDTVVIIDPCMNPDGRDRYVDFFSRTRGRFPNVAPEAREHSEPWPGGRTNHYYFDLNRDWAWGTQAETQQRLPHYQRWMPHIHVDFHEQGVNAPYYFAPAAEPVHLAITPWQRELQEFIGANHARHFDQHGWLYFTRQIFDLFYPGYGDTWPMFNGAIGMTYEQGGSGRAGLGIITAENDTLTLRDRIAGHYTTGLSTIETAATHRTRIVEEFTSFFGDIPAGSFSTFVIKNTNPAKTRALARHLTMQGIAFGSVTVPQNTEGLSYATRKTADVQIIPGDLVISTQQPRHVLTRVLLEPNPALPDSVSYDITAWALPYVYGTDGYALTKSIVPDAAWVPALTTPVSPDERPMAYVAPWRSFADAQLLSALLVNGMNVRFSEIPFTIGNQEYGRGTLIITRGTNRHLGDSFDQAIQAVANLHGHALHPVHRSFETQGVDFGSGDVPYLKSPRVAIIGGPGISAYGLGEIWHYFDQQLSFPATIVNADDFGGLFLYDYDVLILPGGSYSQVLSGTALDRLKEWINDGGRLIAVESAARFLTGKEGFNLQRKTEKEDDKGDDPETDDALRQRRYGDQDREDISESVTGAIFKVTMDPTHPLGFGYDNAYFTLKRSASAFELLKDDWNVGVLEADAHISGFVGAKAGPPLENSLLFGVQPMGRGEVVYMLDNPLFRGFWYNGRLLMANAVFMVGQRSLSRF